MARRTLIFFAALVAACGGAPSDKPAASAADARANGADEAGTPSGGLGLVGTLRPEDAEEARKLAEAVASAKVSLAQGLELASAQGRPIGGEFELEQGKLELWIYTMKGDEFFEVSIDPELGQILQTNRVTSDESLDRLPKPGKAMAASKASLSAIVQKVAAKNAELHALSAFLVADEGHPTVTINLVSGADSHFVTEDVP